MGHTFTNLLYHIAFSTKHRQPWIDTTLKPELVRYMGGIVRGINGHPLLFNGIEDHLHGLVSLPATLCVADALRVLKANSSGWIHEKWPQYRQFAWQAGYGAFTVSESRREALLRYIANQEEHHRKITFQEEFIALLRKHEIDFDPETIWD